MSHRFLSALGGAILLCAGPVLAQTTRSPADPRSPPSASPPEMPDVQPPNQSPSHPPPKSDPGGDSLGAQPDHSTPSDSPRRHKHTAPQKPKPADNDNNAMPNTIPPD